MSGWVVSISKKKKIHVFVVKEIHRPKFRSTFFEGELLPSQISGFETCPGEKKMKLYFFFPKFAEKCLQKIPITGE